MVPSISRVVDVRDWLFTDSARKHPENEKDPRLFNSNDAQTQDNDNEKPNIPATLFPPKTSEDGYRPTTMRILKTAVSILLASQSCQAFLTPISRSSSRCRESTCTQRYFFNFGPKAPAPIPEKEEAAAPAEPEEEPEIIEKIFTFFFGKPEEEPFGLKRFGKERFPEQYPATTTEWADPLEGDDKEMAIVRPLLKNTNLEERGLKLTYSANKNGWNALKFHQAVDKLGGGLVVCKTTSGVVCGGYNPKGWVGYGEARGSLAAFLFQQQPDGSFIKLRKVGGAGLAQMDNPESGPSFGVDSLVIPLGKNSPKVARSKLGSYYERFADGGNSLFGPTQSAVQLKDLKVYHGVYGPDEYIPFTDADPFALS
jgi:hypothetical protein